MSHQAIDWALKQPVKPTSAKHLLTVLAHYVSATRPGPWVAFPSVSQLAQDTGQDRKTIMMNMRRLIEQGCIVDTGAREGGTKSVPVYMLAGHSSSTKIGTSLGGQSSTNPHTASTPEAVPIQGHLSSTRQVPLRMREAVPIFPRSSTNLPPKQYQSTLQNR